MLPEEGYRVGKGTKIPISPFTCFISYGRAPEKTVWRPFFIFIVAVLVGQTDDTSAVDLDGRAQGLGDGLRFASCFPLHRRYAVSNIRSAGQAAFGW